MARRTMAYSVNTSLTISNVLFLCFMIFSSNLALSHAAPLSLPQLHDQASEYGVSHGNLSMTTVYMYRFICFCTVYGDTSIPSLPQHEASEYGVSHDNFSMTTVYMYRFICFCTVYGDTSIPSLPQHEAGFNLASLPFIIEHGVFITNNSLTTVYQYRFICFCTDYGASSTTPSLSEHHQAGFNLTSLPLIIEHGVFYTNDSLTTVYKYRFICFCTDYGASSTTPSLSEHHQANGSILCISQRRMRIGEVHSLDGLFCPVPLNQLQMSQNPSHGSLASSKQILLTTITIIVLIVSFTFLLRFFNRAAILHFYNSYRATILPDPINVLHQEESPNQAMRQNVPTRSDLPNARRRHTIDACIYRNLSPLRITDSRTVIAEENDPPAQMQNLLKRRGGSWRRFWRTSRGRCCFPTSSCFRPSPTME